MNHAPFLMSHKNKALRQAAGDTWGVMKKSNLWFFKLNFLIFSVCGELESGFMIMMTGDSSRTHEAFRTIANSLEIPLINWDLFPSSLLENFVSK